MLIGDDLLAVVLEQQCLHLLVAMVGNHRVFWEV